MMNEISENITPQIEIPNTENNEEHTPDDTIKLIESNEIITETSDPTFIMSVVNKRINSILEPMQDGERMSVGDMCDKIAFATGLKISMVKGFVSFLMKSNPLATVELGRAGGIVKGGRKQHIDMRPRCETCHQVVKQPKP